MRHLLYLFTSALLLATFSCGPQLPPVDKSGEDAIRINQIGYHPGATHQVVLTQKPKKEKLLLVDAEGKKYFRSFEVSDSIDWTAAGETVRTAQVSLSIPGTYRYYVSGIGYSHTFEVDSNVLRPVFVGSMKAFYFQRASQALPAAYAGKWNRPTGHPDTAALYHPFSGYTEGKMDSPGGWYDAGDYNKYVVNGAFPTGQLLALYEDIGDPLPDGQLNIPESGNGKSDYLDEIKVELDWLLTMQDQDGGLFHKLTTKEFAAMDLMPHQATAQRYVVGKGTAATLNFAACMAQAHRVYQSYDASYADTLLKRAISAWNWAIEYPDVAFVNPPDVNTGEYGDGDFTEEWAWAASELFLSTREVQYQNYLMNNSVPLNQSISNGWTGYMNLLGAFSLLRQPDVVPASLYNRKRAELLALADSLSEAATKNPYGIPVTKFSWGSNSDVLNTAMALCAAYQLEPKAAYLFVIRSCVDYILGKNATGYSFVTGFGKHTPMNIHHRQSAADEIVDPVPGLLSGGPNPVQQDSAFATYPENIAPMKSWVDQTGSYASNEICLNWNAPLVYVLGWLSNFEK